MQQLAMRTRVQQGAFRGVTQAAPLRPRLHCAVRAEPDSSSGGGAPALSEDVIARLRAAEEEAARLKRQLADLQQSQSSQAAAGAARDPVLDAKPGRIDGTDRRETLFTAGSGRRNSWLSEEDVDFMTGGGPSEASALSGPTPEQQELIKRRVLISGVAAVALGAFALVPTKDLRVKPSKPLYFYLAALVRAQEQLGQVKELVDNADWDTLRLILPRITGPPGDAKGAMYDAIALLEDRSVVARAEDVAADFLESMANIDSPRRYFDSMPTRAISGAQNAEFVRFSSGALSRAQSKLAEFLGLMPRDAVAAARRAVEAESQE